MRLTGKQSFSLRDADGVLIIAEMSCNHGGTLEGALALLRAAKDVGADGVKLQTYTADTLTIACDRPEFRITGGTPWDGKQLYDLYKEASTPWSWHAQLFEEARKLGLLCFSSPFDATAVDFLETLGVPMYKVASFELVDVPLLEKVGSTGKPVILSTGMASLAEIDEAVATLRRSGCRELALLKCTSAYPAPPEEMNLRTIPHLAVAFGVRVGLSDHSPGFAAPVAAVALGATIVEKHFTLSRAAGGPDSTFSLEPDEFAEMVRVVRMTEKALGEVTYQVTPREAANRQFRRSLFVVEDIEAGESFTERNVRSIRPGHGLPPKYLTRVLGKKAARHLARGTPLEWEMLS